ncbi:MAG: asparagine synthetase B family protein, partial [Nitrospiraceae bacterium]
KSILATHQGCPPNHRAIFDYLQHGALDHSERTFFDGIIQLRPAHILVVRDGVVKTTRYWALPVPAHGQESSIKDEAARFLELMRDSVRVRLRSDVPVGSCLSGGLDSSSIVCLASGSGNGAPRLKTFSSCFEDPAHDERRFITPVLERTGAEAFYVFPDPTELAEKVSRLVWQQDEPFGSTSIFAQWNVMRLASQNGVKVILDGQGADELLAGYQGFFGAFFTDLLKEGRGGTLLRELRAYRRLYGVPSRYALANIARALLPASLVGFVRGRVTGSASWLDPDFRSQYEAVSTSAGESVPHLQGLQRALLTGNGLRALLHYEDRNSMAFGIEARLPYLDFRLVEFLYALDARFKISQGWTKAVLREAMDGILPETVRCRVDKMGFVTPEDQWFRTTLCESAREILADPRCRSRGYLNVDEALDALENHIAGRTNIGNTIWRWLNIELWSRCFLDQDLCVELAS